MPNMREKVKEYILELKEEIDRCVSGRGTHEWRNMSSICYGNEGEDFG